MKIIVCNSGKEVVRKSVELVVYEIKKKSNLVLGLATGETMINFYRGLVSLYKKRKISFSKVRTFNLDEYVGLSSNNKNSYRYFMDKLFFNKVDIARENIYFLRGDADNLQKECLLYEREIKRTGGIDLQILGIGKNGHIGFNEPGSDFNSKTRVVDLSLSTRRANANFFGSFVGFVPQKALTIGIRTILDSKKIALLAFGKAKAKAVFRALKGSVSEEAPASVLQKHRDVTFFLDKAAANKLDSKFI